MFGIGMPELVIILVVALLLLGPKKLPEAARSLGRGMAEFRRASSDLRNSLMEPLDEPDPEPRVVNPGPAGAGPAPKPDAGGRPTPPGTSGSEGPRDG